MGIILIGCVQFNFMAVVPEFFQQITKEHNNKAKITHNRNEKTENFTNLVKKFPN